MIVIVQNSSINKHLQSYLEYHILEKIIAKI